MKGYRAHRSSRHPLARNLALHARPLGCRAGERLSLADIEAALEAAIKTPALLRPRAELGAGMLARKTQSHVVYGFVENDTLIVVAVLHGRMDPKRHFLRGEK